jgi:hypothetical protein
MCYAAAKIVEAEESGDTAAIAYWTGIRDLVDQAPPLSAEQRAVLTVLLRPSASARVAEPTQAAA